MLQRHHSIATLNSIPPFRLLVSLIQRKVYHRIFLYGPRTTFLAIGNGCSNEGRAYVYGGAHR